VLRLHLFEVDGEPEGGPPNPLVFSYMASYDVASIICQALASGGAGGDAAAREAAAEDKRREQTEDDLKEEEFIRRSVDAEGRPKSPPSNSNIAFRRIGGMTIADRGPRTSDGSADPGASFARARSSPRHGGY